MGRHFGANLAARRGIYLLPNLFTTAGMFAGFYAIVASMKGQFATASVAIFIAMIADALDGRVARLTHTQTAFGAQYDSLADMVAFGVAPALLAYRWSLFYLDKLGWLAAFMFTACVALRLARFNTQVGNQDKRFFQGLACPAGAGVIASCIWFCIDFTIPAHFMQLGLAVMMIIVALLMVSNIRYRSFKDLNLKDRVPFIAIVFVMMMFVWITVAPPQMLFSIFLLYTASGPVMTLWALRKKRKFRRLYSKRKATKR